MKEVSALASILDEELASRLIRHLETIYGTQQGEGHVLKTDFQEWYPGRKGEVDFYYWRRLQKYWLDHSILPVQVVQSVDKVTDEILGYLGDPLEGDSWRRRGLVMGHVQSGKTTNYSALIAKAADAGYRVIVVLAGLTNSLRYQTQVRLDQTFVGKSSLGDNFVSEIYPVSYVLKGLEGEGGEIRHPFCGTTQSADFSVKTAKSVGATEGNFADPILFVTKKNEKVLARLADWLRGLRQDGQLEGPMLLIDDEADNASVNTAKDPGVTTRINARIRELLSCSRRSSYVGYTATPFANIFIDPDTEDSMLKDDLFPEHFIKSLEPPGNYIGAEKLFSDGGELFEACIREIPGDY
ncbi:endonuclease, partial [Pseudomonas aeruginosa]|nr:endonuclease [Pseudomonas aeruginosa]